MKKFNKLLGLILVFVVVMVAFCTVSFAADNGEILTGSDEGWKRFDDTHSGIVYTNYSQESASLGYKLVHHISNIGDATASFRFTGTKLRLSVSLTAKATKYIVTIDGNSTSYTPNASGYTALLDLSTKTDLNPGIHTVIIDSTCTGHQVTLDAVDVDVNGEILTNNLVATPGNAKVDLSWNAVPNATSYIVKRALTSGGPYETIANSVTETIYPDSNVTNGTTYYYIVTAIVNGVESGPSNEASATPSGPIEPPVVTGNKAILEIVMTNGTIKEYDLTAQEIQNFLTWYDNRSAGTDKAYISIIKRSNVRPFESRKEFLQFKEIYSFEVKEYKE